MNNKNNKNLWEKIKQNSVFKYFFNYNNEIKKENVSLIKVQKNETNEEVERIKKLIKEKHQLLNLKIIDTSVILREMFITLVENGFIDGIIYIPTFVVFEAHQLSDSRNHEVRQKGKTMLNNINFLIKLPNVLQVELISEKSLKKTDVDYKLIEEYKYLKEIFPNSLINVLTADNNLSSICDLNKVKVFNWNNFKYYTSQGCQKGDTIEVFLTEKGQKNKQARGNTKDGTLVIVENGLDHIKNNINAIVKKIWINDNTSIIFCDFVSLKK